MTWFLGLLLLSQPFPSPPSSCVIPSLCQIASKRQESHCLPWMSRNTHFTRCCKHWLCIAGGWPRLHGFQQPQSTEYGKRICDFCSAVTQGLPKDLQRAAGYTLCGDVPARGESLDALTLLPVCDVTGQELSENHRIVWVGRSLHDHLVF